MSAWGSPEPPEGTGQPEQGGQPPLYGQPPAGPPAQPPYGQPSQPAQPPYGQPVFGQPPYGQPAQPPYGQPPYGQAPYSQPAYGQPAFGQPSFGPPLGPPAGYPGSYPAAGYPGGAGGGYVQTSVGRRASMGARFGGLVIDALILGVVASVFIIPLGGYSSDSSCAGRSCSTNFSVSPLADVFILVLGIVYSAVLVGLTTQTIGHRAVGVRVVDSNDGSAIGPVRAGVRWLVMTVTGAFFTLGYWSPFFDSERRRGWHDKASNSVAVSAR